MPVVLPPSLRAPHWAPPFITAPAWFHSALESDACAFIWHGTRNICKDEVGSDDATGYWMPERDIHGSKSKLLGLGLIDWMPHVQALQANWLLRYLDGYRSPWKYILDAWECVETRLTGPPLCSPRLVTTPFPPSLTESAESPLSGLKLLKLFVASPPPRFS